LTQRWQHDRCVMAQQCHDSAESMTPLNHDSVLGDLNGEYLGKFATVYENILGGEYQWRKGICLMGKTRVRKYRETIPSWG
jgi:hypothetical protein